MTYKHFLLFLLTTLYSGYGKCETQYPKREMRALWVATILNLDFPSTNNLSVSEQKQEFINLLDSMQHYNFNTIVMQVRPSGEVLYPSAYEPWASVLTGKQGKAPNPYYDPLLFMITESHKRNIDFHAWINPYRAVFNYKKTKLSPNHPVHKHPEWFLKYGSHIYYNPALPETRNFITNIVRELTLNYDIDAIHLDDYFYPYPIKNIEFPDNTDFIKYALPQQTKEEWRRENVNKIVESIATTIKEIKPWVQLGISPFGVWRNADKDPKGSDTQAEHSNYDSLYADVLYWIQNNWVDYITPQIYWHIGHPQADYKTLVKWWIQNKGNSYLYIGHALYKVSDSSRFPAWKTADEISKQLKLNSSEPKVSGSMFFRAKVLEKPQLLSLKKELKENRYRFPALPPETIVATNNTPPKAKLKRIKKRTFQLSWESPKGNDANTLKYYQVYMFEGKKKIGNLNNARSIIQRTRNNSLILHRADKRYKRRKRTFVITRINRANQESEISNIIYKKL